MASDPGGDTNFMELATAQVANSFMFGAGLTTPRTNGRRALALLG